MAGPPEVSPFEGEVEIDLNREEAEEGLALEPMIDDAGRAPKVGS